MPLKKHKRAKMQSRKIRINAFIDRCKEIEKSDKFKKFFPKHLNEKVEVTPELLQLIFGKSGFLQAGLDLHYGKFSQFSRISVTMYRQLKLNSICKNIAKTLDKNDVNLLNNLKPKLANIKELIENLSPEVRRELDNKTCIPSEAGKTVAKGVAFVGTALMAKPVMDIIATALDFAAFPGWWILSVAHIMVDLSKPIAAITGIVVGITAAIEKFKNYLDYNEDIEKLKQIQESISEVGNTLKKLNIYFDKCGTASGDFQDFLFEIITIWKKYVILYSKRALRIEKRKKKAQAKGKEISKTDEMDIWKMHIAKTIVKLKLTDAKAFESASIAKQKASASL